MTHLSTSHPAKPLRRTLVLGTLLACATWMTGAQAQTQPPIKILVGAPAGGTTDTMARTLATVLGTLAISATAGILAGMIGGALAGVLRR